MADKAVVTQTTLDAIGQAIIDKGGATEAMTPAQMPAAIQAIPSGAPNRGGTPDDGWKNDGASHFWNYIDEDGGEFVINISKVAVAKCTIFWGDGTSQELSVKKYHPGNLTHSYSKRGAYRVDVVSDEGGNVTFGYGPTHSISSVHYNAGPIYNSFPYTHVELGSNADETGQYVGFVGMTNLLGVKTECIGSWSNRMFLRCGNIKFLEIGEGITSLNDMLSSEYSLLSEFTVPKTVESLNNAFFGTREISKVLFEKPSSVSVLSGTFRNNYGFNSIEIPESVTTINLHCLNIQYPIKNQEIHFRGNVPPTFSDSNSVKLGSLIKVYVPYSADHSVLAAYKSAPNLSVYADQIYEEEES